MEGLQLEELERAGRREQLLLLDLWSSSAGCVQKPFFPSQRASVLRYVLYLPTVFLYLHSAFLQLVSALVLLVSVALLACRAPAAAPALLQLAQLLQLASALLKLISVALLPGFASAAGLCAPAPVSVALLACFCFCSWLLRSSDDVSAAKPVDDISRTHYTNARNAEIRKSCISPDVMTGENLHVWRQTSFGSDN